MNGLVEGNLIQARDIGAVHLHGEHAPGKVQLTLALGQALVRLGIGWGVAVAADLVLTLASLAAADTEVIPVGEDLVLMRVQHEARLSAAVRPDTLPGDQVVTGREEPGYPRLNLRTGAVCGLVGATGPFPQIPGDRDTKFALPLDAVLASEGIETVKMPPRTPERSVTRSGSCALSGRSASTGCCSTTSGMP